MLSNVSNEFEYDANGLRLFLFSGGPIQCKESYLPKDAEAWGVPHYIDGVCYWYSYYRNKEDVFEWDGRKLSTEEISEEMKLCQSQS